jgi:hypothetical protein
MRDKQEGKMKDKKRILVGTFFGFVTGIICFLGGKFGLKDEISTAMFFYILANRTLIGFVIGISPFRMHWALHGIMMGTIGGLPFAAGCLLEQNNLETALAAFILGAVYGFVIELFTSVVFKSVPRNLRALRS